MTITFDPQIIHDRTLVRQLLDSYQDTGKLASPAGTPASPPVPPVMTVIDLAAIKAAVLERRKRTSKDEPLTIIDKYGVRAEGDQYAKLATVPAEKYADLYEELTTYET